VSARKVPLAERLGGKTLLKLLDGTLGDVDGNGRNLVVTRVDRIFRNKRDGEEWREKWQQQGIRLHLADEGGVSVDTSTAMGSFMFSTILNVAAFAADMTAERTSEGLRRRQSENRRVSRYPRYGWKLSADEKYEVENQIEQIIIAKMLVWNAEGLEAPEIADDLNCDGHRRRNGEPWDTRQVNRVLQRALDSV